jgi:hypothetical protein
MGRYSLGGWEKFSLSPVSAGRGLWLRSKAARALTARRPVFAVMNLFNISFFLWSVLTYAERGIYPASTYLAGLLRIFQ